MRKADYYLSTPVTNKKRKNDRKKSKASKKARKRNR